MNMFEESVRVPFIASCPGRIPSRKRCGEMLSHYDFLPTILDFTGTKGPSDPKLPGRSFAAILAGKPSSGHEQLVVFDEYGPVRMVRTREWKYVLRNKPWFNELYDLVNDPGETKNLIDDPSRRAVVKELSDRLHEWFTRYSDPAKDGFNEPVNGRGQMYLCGTAGKDRKVYHDPDPPNNVRS